MERFLTAFALVVGFPVRLCRAGGGGAPGCNACQRGWMVEKVMERDGRTRCTEFHLQLQKLAIDAKAPVVRTCGNRMQVYAVALPQELDGFLVLECGPFQDDRPVEAGRSREGEPVPPALGDKRARAMVDFLVFLAKGVDSFARGSRPPFVAEVPKVIFVARQYIEENAFSDDLTLARVAARVGRSPDYLSKVFRQTMGAPFTEYLNRIRVDRVCDLLGGTSVGVAELAMSCGFGSVPHFNRVFRRYTGLSPTAYREAARKAPGRTGT